MTLILVGRSRNLVTKMLMKLMIGLAAEGVATMTEQTRKSGFDLDEILAFSLSGAVRSGLELSEAVGEPHSK